MITKNDSYVRLDLASPGYSTFRGDDANTEENSNDMHGVAQQQRIDYTAMVRLFKEGLLLQTDAAAVAAGLLLCIFANWIFAIELFALSSLTHQTARPVCVCLLLPILKINHINSSQLFW